MGTSRLLVIVVALQGLILAGQWTGGRSYLPQAQAVPDAGAQQNQIIDELRATNGKLDKLIGILESGKLQVRVVPSDEKSK
ncbi:MAG TPA: hypothetical protein VIL86_11745 [Tepidisphaeraceae bacterium]|jgi:hypothetical protein